MCKPFQWLTIKTAEGKRGGYWCSNTHDSTRPRNLTYARVHWHPGVSQIDPVQYEESRQRLLEMIEEKEAHGN